eukprot:364815-Chlamydomonas_euryale.AAC.11
MEPGALRAPRVLHPRHAATRPLSCADQLSEACARRPPTAGPARGHVCRRGHHDVPLAAVAPRRLWRVGRHGLHRRGLHTMRGRRRVQPAGGVHGAASGWQQLRGRGGWAAAVCRDT